MKLIHVSILAVASALFAIGAVAWLCVLPDGTKQTFDALIRIDTPVEIDYYRNGGILPTVLRKLAEA